MMTLVTVLLCAVGVPVEQCSARNALAVERFAQPGGISHCMREGARYAARAGWTSPSTYPKIRCTTGARADGTG